MRFLQDDYKALPWSHVRPVYPVPVQLQLKRTMPTLVHWPPCKQGFESHGAAGGRTGFTTAGETKNEKKNILKNAWYRKLPHISLGHTSP